MVRSISILGSTGSIGRQTVAVAEHLGLQVRAISTNRSIGLAEEQARKLHPAMVAVTDERAAKELKIALALAVPDRLWLPFAENAPHLSDLWNDISDIRRPLHRMTERFLASRAAILRKHFPARWDEGLTDRERDVAVLAAQRLSGHEIAERLQLSENTVKTHLRRAYEKLGISGADRNKRAALERIAGQ